MCVCLVAHLTPCDPMDCSSPGSSVHRDSPGKNTGVGCYSLLLGIFWTHGWNLGLLHCRRILYQLSHQGSAWILECVAYPFSRGSSWPRDWTGVSCIAGRFFINWALREAPLLHGILWNSISLASVGAAQSILTIQRWTCLICYQ